MDLRFLLFVAFLSVCQCKLLRLSCNDIRELVDGHNWRRLQLAQGKVEGQPPASEMTYMVWDDELAAKAAKWAVKNLHSHNPDRTIGSGRFKTGENIYWFGTNAKNYKFHVTSALEAWFEEEYKAFKYGPLKPSDFEETAFDIGHYTQMAWAETTRVGCAVSMTYGSDQWTRYVVVCNYGPGGNYMQQVPYKTNGKPSNQLICSIGDCTHPYGDRC